MAAGLPVTITVAMGGRKVPIDEVKDTRIATALRAAGEDVGRRLKTISCPEHRGTATNVRIHFDPRGNADLQYDSCCAKLGAVISKALG